MIDTGTSTAIQIMALSKAPVSLKPIYNINVINPRNNINVIIVYCPFFLIEYVKPIFLVYKGLFSIFSISLIISTLCLHVISISFV